MTHCLLQALSSWLWHHHWRYSNICVCLILWTHHLVQLCKRLKKTPRRQRWVYLIVISIVFWLHTSNQTHTRRLQQFWKVQTQNSAFKWGVHWAVSGTTDSWIKIQDFNITETRAINTNHLHLNSHWIKTVRNALCHRLLRNRTRVAQSKERLFHKMCIYPNTQNESLCTACLQIHHLNQQVVNAHHSACMLCSFSARPSHTFFIIYNNEWHCPCSLCNPGLGCKSAVTSPHQCSMLRHLYRIKMQKLCLGRETSQTPTCLKFKSRPSRITTYLWGYTETSIRTVWR